MLLNQPVRNKKGVSFEWKRTDIDAFSKEVNESYIIILLKDFIEALWKKNAHIGSKKKWQKHFDFWK